MAPALSFIGGSGMVQLLLLSLLGQPPVATAAGHMGAVTIHARIIDWYCWGRALNGMLAPDGSDIVASPKDHKVECLQLDNCKAEGYYLAVQCSDGNWTPLYDLYEDNVTMAAVATYVNALTPASKTDIMVTVTGTNHNGVIEDGQIADCSGTADECSHGACDGKCVSKYTNMMLTDHGYPGCVADSISSTDGGGNTASFGTRTGIDGALLMAVSVLAGLVASR